MVNLNYVQTTHVVSTEMFGNCSKSKSSRRITLTHAIT